MDFNTIEVTQEQINQVPNKNFVYGVWQQNYCIPVNSCRYNEESKLYKIGAMPECDKKTIARYLKINVCKILPDETKEISYNDLNLMKEYVGSASADIILNTIGFVELLKLFNSGATSTLVTIYS